MDLLTIGGIGSSGAVALAAEEAAGATGLQINLFWIIVASLNFILLFVLLSVFALGPLRRMLDERRARIEEGLRDAEQARRDRESAEAERVAALQEARREANEIITRAQKVAQDSRDADIAATKAELERLRDRRSSGRSATSERKSRISRCRPPARSWARRSTRSANAGSSGSSSPRAAHHSPEAR
jgi:ATP synthase F0 subunit b